MMLRTHVAKTGTALLAAGALGLMPGAMAAGAAPAGSAAPSAIVATQAPAPTVPVEGTLPDGTAFTGALSDLSTSVVDGVVQLSGTITGTGLPAGGTDFTAPITDLTANAERTGCSILNLDLGPLDLDVLGLVIELEPVILDITAVPGPGKLLGNLLCAVTGLFDGPGNALGGISALLNRILGGLGL
jgi:hypothetical protein